MKNPEAQAAQTGEPLEVFFVDAQEGGTGCKEDQKERQKA